MTCNEFINSYWSQYILLEKEFVATHHYLSLDSGNDNAFSQAYAKLILELGSEIDVVLKQYCQLLVPEFRGEKMRQYREFIKANKPEFIDQIVVEKATDRLIKPWEAWNQDSGKPSWWTAYNKVKHDRTSTGEIDGVTQEYYKFANQKYIRFALAGLYQILVYTYHKLATDEGKSIVTPMSGSRVFQLQGGIWDTILFFDDIAVFVDDTGCMIMEASTLHY